MGALLCPFVLVAGAGQINLSLSKGKIKHSSFFQEVKNVREMVTLARGHAKGVRKVWLTTDREVRPVRTSAVVPLWTYH